MKFRVIILAIFLVILTGCATSAKYNAILDSWMGKDVNNLVNSWGYPQNSFKAPNGNTVYVYGHSGSYTMPTQTNTTHNVVGNTVYSNSQTTGGQTLNFWCRTFIEANEQNIIVNWRWEGNNCVAN